MVNEFAKLVCGASGSAGSFGGVTAHLSTSVKVVISEILKLPAESPERIALFGPFLGRSVVELTYTALVGRLDPFRLLALREIQMEQTAGDAAALGERCMAAIQWSGDIRPMKDGENQELWSPSKPMDKIHRSLFGKHYEQIYWIPAFTTLIDSLTDEQQGAWFDELRKITPESFTPRFRADSDRTYSSLSKGIHHEFVIPPEKFYSPETVFELLKDALRVSASSALVCHAIPTCQYAIPLNEAMSLYDTVQKAETTLCLPKPKMTQI
jgi:hypothetical protein